MRRTQRLFIVFALIAALVGVGAPPAHAQKTTAVAINTKDGTSLFRFAFAIKHVGDEVLDTTNAAAAVSSCQDCRTLAISVQIVIVMSSPSVATPENFAIALNVECLACETGAFAFQFVIGTGERLKLTKEGRELLKEIELAIAELGASWEAGDLSLEELDAALDPLIAQIEAVLQTELEPVGPSEEEVEESAPPTVVPSASQSISPSPSESQRTSPSPSESAVEPSPTT